MRIDLSHIKKFIEAEFEDLKARIANNIRANQQWASGKTAEGMHIETAESAYLSIALIGREDFENLETGVAPTGQRPGYGFHATILQWMKDKGIFDPNENLDKLAWAISTNILQEGTALWRSEGGRTDVFSNEIPVALANIDSEFDEQLRKIAEAFTI